MKKVFFNLSHHQANLAILVLTSVSIQTAAFKNNDDLWDISVLEKDNLKSIEIMMAYFNENKSAKHNEILIKPQKPDIISSLSGILILHAFFFFINSLSKKDHVVQLYNSSAYDIMKGELYRTVTSLFLHADYLHLLNNSIFLFLFSIHVFTKTGSGSGWFLILFSGALGNLINAYIYRYYHYSIGSSTAVFGTLGIIVATHVYSKIKIHGLRQKSWIPFAGGLAFLSLAGTGGKNVDVMAHLWGFGAGLLTGFTYITNEKYFKPKKNKAILTLLLFIWIVVSWLTPLFFKK